MIGYVLKTNSFCRAISDQLNDCIRLLVTERNKNAILKRQYNSFVQSSPTKSLVTFSLDDESNVLFTSSCKLSLTVLPENEAPDDHLFKSK